jgi:hypothetical protein
MIFSKFKAAFRRLLPYHPLPTDSFLCWFIGFSEGDGGFFTCKDPTNNAFVIVQSLRNYKALLTIQEALGIGTLTAKNNMCRYSVRKKEHLELLLKLFNGNMVLPTSVESFKKFLHSYNNKPFLNPIIFRHRRVYPSLDMPWFVGFTEADGCFAADWEGSSSTFVMRFFISQVSPANKGVLDVLKLLFPSGTVQCFLSNGPKKKQSYTFVVSGLHNLSEIVFYFDRFPFWSITEQQYAKWRQLLGKLLRKDDQDPELRHKVLQLYEQLEKCHTKNLPHDTKQFAEFSDLPQ